MNRISHNGNTIGNQSTDKFDDGKNKIQPKCPTDPVGVRFMVVMVMVMMHSQFNCLSDELSKPESVIKFKPNYYASKISLIHFCYQNKSVSLQA